MNTRPFVLCWGELLWDEFDDTGEERALGGCASNVAVHLARLGTAVSLVSRVGNDERGRQAASFLQSEGVDTTCVSIDPELATARVRIDLTHEEPSYRMLSRMDWSRLEFDGGLRARLPNCVALVYGTLAQRSDAAAGRLSEIWHALPNSCLRVCDLNLRGQRLAEERLVACVAAANVIKLNEQELALLEELLGVSDGVAWLLSHARVELVALTLGSRGVELHREGASLRAPGVALSSAQTLSTTDALSTGDAPGSEVLASADAFGAGQMPSPVGAGDAFCARLVVGSLRGEDDATLARACNAYAARVASRRAAV